jgi:hypothetical protein
MPAKIQIVFTLAGVRHCQFTAFLNPYNFDGKKMDDFFKLLWPSEKISTLLDTYIVSTKLQPFLKIVMLSRST